jgi:hypothetical protein
MSTAGHYAILDTVAGEYTVMGYGISPEDAMAEAHAADADWNWAGSRYVEITQARAARILAGDNTADDLWGDAHDASSYLPADYTYTIFDADDEGNPVEPWAEANVKVTSANIGAFIEGVSCRAKREAEYAGDVYVTGNKLVVIAWDKDRKEVVRSGVELAIDTSIMLLRAAHFESRLDEMLASPPERRQNRESMQLETTWETPEWGDDTDKGDPIRWLKVGFFHAAEQQPACKPPEAAGTVRFSTQRWNVKDVWVYPDGWVRSWDDAAGHLVPVDPELVAEWQHLADKFRLEAVT